ncbi:MAG: glycoside hydrolase family 31 protein [Candidatus Thermoplasmatota archaeon]|nr:glycoside hydrolase family 31 protein [Candidatus Thermoplasmatota archaeon]
MKKDTGILFLPKEMIEGKEGIDLEGYTPIGSFKGIQEKEGKVHIECENAAIYISAINDGTIKVQLAPHGKIMEEHSYAVVKEDAKPLSIKEKKDEIELSTSEVKVVVNKKTVLLSFYDKEGTILCKDREPMKWKKAKEGHRCLCTREMPLEEHYYGLGEKSGFIDKRRSSSVMWNTDAYSYDSRSDPLYVSVPFFIGLRDGKAYGIFFDNTYKSYFDFGVKREDSYLFGSSGGELRYYFFYGPNIKKVVERYTELTGKPFMPPLWALGHQISRYSYYPQERVIEVARKMREHRIPCDAMYLDIDHNEGFVPFTWSKDFPQPERMVKELKAMGFEIIPIVDPALKDEIYKEAFDRGYLLKRKDKVYMDHMWPGLCAWPDFTREEVREWWGEKYRTYTELGIEGIWNDMNEPSVFNERKTMKDDVIFGNGFSHLKNHNAYALLEVCATYEGLKKLGVKEPFVLSRAGFAGIQRYAALWTGDNTASWEHLALQIPMLLNMGLSGLSFTGSDIGGFIDAPSPELLVRWYEASALVPFFRNHTGKGNYDQEPWVYGKHYEDIIRKHVEMRYELLPYLYSLAYESHTKGYPVIRPLFFEFQGDKETYTIDDEFMIGPFILVAPIIKEGARTREIYLPEGKWYDYHDKKEYEGGKRIVYEAPLDKLPIFVKDGAIIPKQNVTQSTKEKATIFIEKYGSEHGTFTLYWDGNERELNKG